MDKSELIIVPKIGANCTDVDCKKLIPNSDCFAGLCKCKVSYGPTSSLTSCKKSKKFGSSCHPISDGCYSEKLYCDENLICNCGPGYRYDSAKNECIWVFYCDENLIWDSLRRTCIKSSDYWFPTTNHNPKLSFLTFILLVFCFIKVMRSNSPYNDRRRRISANMNRNSFDLLSTIMNYETNQRYPRHSERNLRNHLRPNEDGQEVFYDENTAPPAYEDIINDLKTVTVINNNSRTANDANYLASQSEDIELKEINQAKTISQTNLNNNKQNVQHIENQSTSSVSSLENNSGGINQDIENNNLNPQSIDNRPNDQPINETNSQINHQIVNVQLNGPISGQSNNQSLSDEHQDQLPTYQQAISKMPPV